MTVDGIHLTKRGHRMLAKNPADVSVASGTVIAGGVSIAILVNNAFKTVQQSAKTGRYLQAC